jgi:hypothetical protein
MSKPAPKKRHDTIIGVTKGSVSKLTITYDKVDGSIFIHELDPETIHLVRSHDRTSGKEKVLTSIKSANPRVPFDVLPALRANFDFLLAIDTNTRVIAGRRVSITVAYRTPKSIKIRGDIAFIPVCGYVMLDVDSSINPERLGWQLVLSSNIDAVALKHERLGVIVDSELGALPEMNSRSQPIYEDSFLPNFATLIYASDASADSLPSQMIRYCDKAAEAVFSRLMVDLSILEGVKMPYAGCAGYAWFPIGSA